ncbi:MAG: 6-pyruvoyl-tetrahydropterin synthase-related protein [Anaerolineae bacterium]
MTKAGALAFAVIIGLLAAWPFLGNPGLPAGTDAELHVFRIAELGYSVKAGNIYPRWAPDFFHGYGYPIFNYYAPLTYHLGYLLTLGRPELAAVGAKSLFVLGHVIGAVGAYLLGKTFGGRGGGLLGALAFSFSPYVQLINPHLRGDLAESFAIACLPWALWGWENVWRRRGTGGIAAALVGTSGAFLSHNLTGLATVALIASLSAWRWLVTGHRQVRKSIGVAMAFVLLTAFFWLPFLLERPAVQLDVVGEGHYDFRKHFVLPAELVAPLAPIDTRATTPDVPMTLGPAVVALALLGTIHSWRRRELRSVGFYGLAAVALSFMTTRGSQSIWEAVPGLAYFQFPWRLLGPIAALLVPPVAAVSPSLAVARAAGQTSCPDVHTRRRPLTAATLPGLAALIILIGALPAFYPPPWQPGFSSITPQDIVEAELSGRWRGTTSTNDFVPTTVDMIPGPEQSVIESYAAAPPVDRVNRHTLPEGTVVRVISDRPWVNRFAVITAESFTLRLYLFHFPGWRAYVDGERVPIDLAHPEGFITLEVPAGEHEVIVRFGSTFARTAGWLLSAVGVIATIVLVRRLATDRGSAPADPHDSEFDAPRRDGLAVVSVATAVTLLLVTKPLLLDRGSGRVTYASPLGTARPADYGQRADLGGEIALLGYDLSGDRLSSGDVLEVSLYWMAQRPLTQTYQSFVHLVYPEGRVWTQSDHLNPAGFPTNRWPQDRYIRDTHRLELPPDLPPGTYLLSVGLYTLADNRRLDVWSASCGQRPDAVVLCQPIVVRR